MKGSTGALVPFVLGKLGAECEVRDDRTASVADYYPLGRQATDTIPLVVNVL